MFNFRIVEERVINYPDGQRINLSLIAEEDKYGVMITTDKDFLYQHSYITRTKAEGLLKQIEKNLMRCNAFAEAKQAIEVARLMLNSNLFLFYLNVFNNTLSIHDIRTLQRNFELKTLFQHGTEEVEDPLFQINVYHEATQERIGSFEGHFGKSDFTFTLNSDFILT